VLLMSLLLVAAGQLLLLLPCRLISQLACNMAVGFSCVLCCFAAAAAYDPAAAS
jgi:hypothetical protein